MTAPTVAHGPLTELATGLCAYLTAQQPAFVYQPSGAYPTDGSAGIPLAILNVPQAPARLTVITPYPLTDDPTWDDSTVGVQLRSRSDLGVLDVMDIDDAAADVLLGNFPLLLPSGVHLNTLVRTSAVSLGQDDVGRWEWASNYETQLCRPSTHRP